MKIIQLVLLYFYSVCAMVHVNLTIPTLLLIVVWPFQVAYGHGVIEKSFRNLSFLFFSLIVLSLFWTISTEHTIASIKEVCSAIVFASSVRMYINDRRDLYDVLHMFVISGVLLLIYFLLHGLLNLSLTSRIDTTQMDVEEGVFNFNGVSSSMILMSIALYILSKRYNNFLYNIILVVFIIITLGLTVISSSKMSIMMFAITASFWYFNKGNRRSKFRWFKLLVIAAAVVGVIWISLNNEVLYLIYGYRFESLYMSLFEGEQGTFSDQTRIELIDLSYKTFLQYPIFGCGANAFRYVSSHSNGILGGLDFYAHNNYLELLATLGIVGFFLYYAIYYSLYLHIKRNLNNNFAMFLYFIMFLLLLNDFGTVNYRIPQRWMIIAVLYSSVSLLRIENQVRKNTNYRVNYDKS